MTSLEFPLENPAGDPHIWALDEKVIFLNHGSFGSCPRPVLEFQRELRERLERQPVQFLARELEGLLDAARRVLAQFTGAQAEDLVFVSNATTGVNTVLRSLEFRAGDELLVTDHEYNACRNALDFAAGRAGVRVVVAKVPFPISRVEEITAAILEAVTSRTRLALIDHVTSPTGMVMPIEQIVAELKARGVDTLVDGAHGPGMVPLDLEGLGAAYYTGNCHKWLCAPKGAGFLHVRKDRQALIHPLTISHGANSPRTDRSRFLIEFGWTGTLDPSAYLSVAESLRCVGAMMPGGWPEVMARNRALALSARRIFCETLEIAEPCPGECIGSLATVPIPDARSNERLLTLFHEYPLQEKLRVKHGIEVPIIPWPQPPRRLLRVSAQLYNSLPQYRTLAKVLLDELN